MRIGNLGAVIGAALVLAACAADEDMRRAAALEDDMFLGAALVHVQSQLELARLAATKARTPSLVAYARRVAAERAQLLDQLGAAAKPLGAGADLNQGMRPDTFRPLQGEAFERSYVAGQIEDQQNNLDHFAYTAQNGTDPGLRQIAEDALPQLRQDLVDVQAIVKDLPFETTSDTSTGSMPTVPLRAR